MKSWLENARAFIAQITRWLPDDAPLTERRNLLRREGHRFHGGTFWGRRKYGQACREYLARYGGKEPGRLVRASDRAKLSSSIAKGDVHFPFRESPP